MHECDRPSLFGLFWKSKSDSESRFDSKPYLIAILKKIQSISTKANKFEISTFYIQNLSSSQTKLKGFGGLISTLVFFWKDQIFIFGNTWKILESWRFLILFPKVFHRKGLKNGWKKFTKNFWSCASRRI